MGMFLGIVGMFGVPVCLIWLIVRLFKRDAKKPPLIGMLVCIVLFFVGIAMVPTSDHEDADPSEDISGEENQDLTEVDNSKQFEVTMSVAAGGEYGKPFFTISTNLPDETKLMLTLSDGANYTAQTHVTVEDGSATSDEFSSGGDPISGEYVLTVSMSLPSLQSDNVRASIGEKGENITGQYVVADDITGSNCVRAEFDFQFEGESNSVPENNDEPEKRISLADMASLFEITLSSSYSGCNVESDDSGITVNIWSDGLVMALAATKAAGGGADNSDWVNAKESTTAMVTSLRGTMDTAGLEDSVLVVNVLNDQNHDNILLSYINTTIIYDVMNG